MPLTTTPFPGPVQPVPGSAVSAGVEDPARLSPQPPSAELINEAPAPQLSGPPVNDGVSPSATPVAAASPVVAAPSTPPHEAPPPAPSEAKGSQIAQTAQPPQLKDYVSHEDAEAIVELYPSLDPEGQASALGVISRYQDQQAALRQPLFPDEERDNARQRQQFYSLFNQGLDGARKVLPDRRALGGPPTDEAIARSAATAYLARRFRLPERTIGKAFEFYRDFYAREVFKTPTGVDNRAFYELARKDVEIESQRVTLIQQAADSAFNAAILSRNAGMGEYVNWIADTRQKPGYHPGMNAVWRENFDAYRAALLPRLPMLESFTQAIQRRMDSRPLPEDSKIIADSTSALLDMPAGDQQVTLQALMLMARRAGEEQPGKGTDLGIPGSKAVTGFAQQTGEAFSRTLLEMFDISKLAQESRLNTLGRSLDIPHTTEVGTIATPADAQRFVREQMLKISTHQAIGSPGIASSMMDGQTAAGAIGFFMLLNDKGQNRTLSDAEKALVRDQLGRDQKAIDLARQIERAAAATDPVKNIAAQATGSLAAFLTVDLLPGGLAVNALGMANAAYNGITTDHPEIGRDKALALSVTSGALQAAIFRIPVGKLVGMPTLSKHLTEGITTDLIRRSAVSALKLGPAQFGQMEIAGLTTPFLQQVGHALDADIPDPRLKDIVLSRWQEVSTQPAHVALSMLPLILLGTGAHAIRERTTVREVLSQRDHMEALGIRTDDAHRIASLLADGKVDDAQAAYQTAFSRKGPADAAKIQALALKATARQVDDYHAYSEAVRLNLMPEYNASSDGGVTVLLPDGKGGKNTVQTTGWKEAWAISRQYFRAQEQRRIQAVGQMADALLSQPRSPGLTETSTYTPGKDLPFDRTTEEGRRAIAIAAHLQDMTPEAAASAHWAALGSNTLEQLQGMRSLILNSRSQAARNASVLTPVEEHIEGRVKAALRTGRHSLEQTLAWVRMAEQATGKTFLPASNEAILRDGTPQAPPRELLEAISHIVVADVMGRRKDGTAFAPGLITEGLDAHVREGMQAWHRTYTARAQDGSLTTQEAGNQARTFKHFLASWREFFGQTFRTALALQKARQQGTLTQDWQRHLDELLGLRDSAPIESAINAASTQRLPLASDPTYAVRPVPYLENIEKAVRHQLPPNAILDLGTPGGILRAAGVPDLNMHIRQSTIRTKRGKHSELELEALKKLPEALNNPMLVYLSPGDRKAHSIITTIQTSQGPIAAYFTAREREGQMVLEAKSIYGRLPGEVLSEAARAEREGLMRYQNKEAFDAWRSAQGDGPAKGDASAQHNHPVEGSLRLFTENSESQENAPLSSSRTDAAAGSSRQERERDTTTASLGNGEVQTKDQHALDPAITAQELTSYSLTPFKPLSFITKRFNRIIDDWLKTGDAGRELIHLGMTPPVLQMAGANEHILMVPPTLLDKVTANRHQVPVDVLRALPESLADPVAVFQSRTHSNSILVLTEFDEPGHGPVLAAITLDKQAGRNLVINEVASLYGKSASTIAAMFGESVLYENKQKSSVWARRVGQLLPKRGTPSQNQGIVPGPEEVVKLVEARRNASGNPSGVSVPPPPAPVGTQDSSTASTPATFSKKTGTGPSQIETSFSLAPSASGETEHPLANKTPNDRLSHDQTRRNSNDPPGGPGITPGIIARDVLRRDRSTVSAEPPGEALRGNTTSRRAEFDRLLESEQTRNLNFDSRRLGKQLDSAGEHMVYKAARPEDEGRVFKVTHPDRAGITGRALKLRDGSLKVMPDDALPSEYLDRWELHNELLDDDARFEGFIQGPHGTSLVVSHPLVKGQHPKSEELSKALFARGWRPTGDGHWQIKYHGQTIGLTDTKPANFIRTSDSAIHSIDSVPFVATQAMIDHWAKLAPK